MRAPSVTSCGQMLDYVARRVLKIAIKKGVGRWLGNEDLDLDVALGSGRVELRDVLLNCEALNKDLVGWHGVREAHFKALLVSTL